MISDYTRSNGLALRRPADGSGRGSLGRTVGYVLFFLMLTFPMAPKLLQIKGALFAATVYFSVLMILWRQSTQLAWQVICWGVALAGIGASFVLLGGVSGTSGEAILQSIQIYVAWPLAYLVLVSPASELRTLFALNRVAVLSALAIGAYGLTYVLAQLNFIPNWQVLTWLSFGLREGIGLHGQHTEIDSIGINSLAFLVPFVIGLLAFAYDGVAVKVPRSWLWAATVLDLAVILLSGRRALFVVVIAAVPVATVIAASPAKGRSRMGRSIGIAIFAAIGLIVLGQFISLLYPKFAFSGAWRFLAEGFELTSSSPDYAARVRAEEFASLIDGFAQAPLFGHGLGTSAEVIRSSKSPWSYELSYAALLFHVGLVGVLIYLSAVLWIYRSALRIIRANAELRWLMWSILLGMTGMLIANATNPYLDRFDGLWALFWPLSVVNYWLTRCNNQSAFRHEDISR